MSEEKTIQEISDNLLDRIDCYTLVKDVLKNLWVIILTGLIACILVNMLPYIGYKPMYRASSTVIVTGTAKSGDSFSTYIGAAEDFIGVLTDEYLKQEVEEELGLGRLDVKISANAMIESNVIELAVEADNPTLAYRTLKGILGNYQEISELMLPGYMLEEMIPATYPQWPCNSYDVTQLRKKAALLSMAAMTLLILACSFFYDSVKNEKDVEAKLDTKLYAAIYHERKYKTMRRLGDALRKKKKSSLLIQSATAGFGFVESYKRLKEKIVTRCTRSGKKVILITSMLENEGKSTVCANLALALAAGKKNVALLDADLRQPAQFKIFERYGIEQTPLSDYLCKKAELEDCIRYDKETGMYFVYNQEGRADSSEIIGNKRMKDLLAYLRETMDYIIIDTPPLDRVSDAEILAQFADYSLLVITPDHAPTKAVNDCIDQLNACQATLLGCVLNNIRTIPLVLSQTFGISAGGFLNQAGGSYLSRYGYGYGYGSSYGYGKKKQESKKQTTGDEKTMHKRGNAFFAEPVEQIKKEVE